jgi:hypothetical protein
MYLVATGEPPFRDRSFDMYLVCDILGGLRPTLPDSTPDGYKKLAEMCCDADPNKRPGYVGEVHDKIDNLIVEAENDKAGNGIWNNIYYNDIKPISRLEKESKYSSKLLSNVYALDSVPGMKVIDCIFGA